MDTSWPWRVTESEAAELWDLTRPLIGDCHMELLKFDDPEAKAVSQQLTHIDSCFSLAPTIQLHHQFDGEEM